MRKLLLILLFPVLCYGQTGNTGQKEEYPVFFINGDEVTYKYKSVLIPKDLEGDKGHTDHKNEATSSSGYISITKDLAKPANITIVDGSVKFVDQNQNNAIDANEQCSIQFTIQNTGIGEGMGMKLVTDKVYGNDVKFNNNIPIGNLSPGAIKSVKLSIQAGMNTSDAKAHFKFVVNELHGFGSNAYEIDIPVKPFVAPELVVVDYKVSSQAGKIVKKEAFDVELVVQNIGQGTAKNIKVNLTIPQNVFVMDGEENTTIPVLEAGASKVIACQMIANNNYSSSEITIKADLSESYGKYAKDKNIVMQMDQVVSSNKLSLTAKEQQNTEIKLVSLSSAVDKNIPVSAVKYDNRIALIIGNEDYSQSINAEINVDYAVNDATVFKKYANKVMGVKEENTFFITNASTGTMEQQINIVSKLAKNMGSSSEIIFYYAGHGLPDEKTKEPYIMPVDVDASNLYSAIKLKDLYAKLANSNAKRVTVFLDACFSGGARNMPLLAARSAKVKPKNETINGNIIVFSATSEEQSALSFDKEKHGMFTYFLLKKLQESSGKATYKELKEFINSKVSVESIRTNRKEQNPEVNISPVIKEVWKYWSFR